MGHTASGEQPSSGLPLNSAPCLQRERFLVQHTETGQYLSGAVNGKLTWTADPRQAFRYTLMETVLEQLRATREFYKVSDVQVASVIFTINPSAPDRLDAWEVSGCS